MELWTNLRYKNCYYRFKLRFNILLLLFSFKFRFKWDKFTTHTKLDLTPLLMKVQSILSRHIWLLFLLMVWVKLNICKPIVALWASFSTPFLSKLKPHFLVANIIIQAYKFSLKKKKKIPCLYWDECENRVLLPYYFSICSIFISVVIFQSTTISLWRSLSDKTPTIDFWIW